MRRYICGGIHSVRFPTDSPADVFPDSRWSRKVGSYASVPREATDQTSESETEKGDFPKIRVGTNEVNVVFTVTDKHGKRVTDLKQADFRIRG